MNALHLLWIVPVSFFLGMFVCALLSANGGNDNGGRMES